MIQPISAPSFKAVNPKYLKMAQEEHQIMNTVSGDLIEKLQFDILTKKVSKEDGIDTVKAFYQYTKQKYHFLLDGLLDMHCLK
ncbi:MAG: hypothetical protein NC408_10045 [Candidatus Gastranaerophilales bacterium]|nr:hypothetical protein [Candidatus Gastranaerophilales bacterium]